MNEKLAKWYKAVVSAIVGVLALWIPIHPTLFPNHPFMRDLAVFIVAGGFASLGFTLPRKGNDSEKK